MRSASGKIVRNTWYEGRCYSMTLTHKLLLALTTMLLSPAIIAFVAFGRWSRDNIDISIPAGTYLLPLFLVALLIRAFHARKVAVTVYILGMVTFLTVAIKTLWAELHGPVIGYVYIPTILLTFPFGLMAILHRTVQRQQA